MNSNFWLFWQDFLKAVWIRGGCRGTPPYPNNYQFFWWKLFKKHKISAHLHPSFWKKNSFFLYQKVFYSTQKIINMILKNLKNTFFLRFSCFTISLRLIKMIKNRIFCRVIFMHSNLLNLPENYNFFDKFLCFEENTNL